MFRKLSALALFAPLVAGTIVLNIPKAPVSGGSITITWTSAATDGTFSLELLNTVFNNAFAIANNVSPTDGSITLTLPVVPVGDGYTIEAVNIGNINQVYASTGSFSIGANTATGSTSASTSATGSGTGTASGASSTGTGVSVSLHSTGVASTGFGTTQTGPATFSTGSAAGTSTAATTAPATTGTVFNGAAAFKMNSQVGAVAAAFFSAVAGAALFAL